MIAYRRVAHFHQRGAGLRDRPQYIPGYRARLRDLPGFRGEPRETSGGNPERAADLYLACACIEQLPAAVAEFMARFGARIPRYLSKLARNADLVAEVRQTLVTRCIVGEVGHPPALSGYSATGSLEGWLRATAVREALALNRTLSNLAREYGNPRTIKRHSLQRAKEVLVHPQPAGSITELDRSPG